MNEKLYISNSQLVISYKRDISIRKKVFDFEDGLKSEFKVPFRTVAIPDELDPNIPRFESESIHGFSRLAVSQNRINLSTNYDEKFKSSIEKVEEYLIQKIELLSTLTKIDNIEFIAYVIELGVIFDESQINSFIKLNTGVFAVSEECRDFSLLYSKQFNEDFYLNVKCSKFNEQEMTLNLETQSLRPTGNIKYGISVVLDINTRPFFEKNKSFDPYLYSKTNSLAFNIIKNKSLIDFLKGNI